MAVVSTSKFNFKETMDQFLREYYINAWDVVGDTINEVGKEAAKKLRSTSPGKGNYKKGWAYKAAKEGRAYRNAGGVVYGKSGTYQLAHLLENSHAKRGGGRTSPGDGQVVHIAPVEQWAIDEAQERIIKRLSGL